MSYRFRMFSINLSLLALLFVSYRTHAQEVFSVDIPSGAPFAGGDILFPGPFTAIADSAIASGGALTGVEINGISDGNDLGEQLLFSVDNASMGMPGTDVSLEFTGGATPFDHPADIYLNPLGMPGTNFIFRDGDGVANPLLAPPPALGLTEPFPVATDNTDAYDFGAIGPPPPPTGGPGYMGPIFFTVGAPMPGAFAPEDINLVGSPGGPVATYASGVTDLLLLTAGATLGDDIDAIFVLDDGDGVFSSGMDVVGFSLERFSPSLSAGSALSLSSTGGAALSPADVFIFTGTGGGTFSFYVPAASHGLLFEDNIDALDQFHAVPEPASGLLAMIALGIVCCSRRRR